MSFLAYLTHFGVFLTLFEPLGRNENYFRKSENVTFTPYHVVTSCKISEKYNGCPLRKVDADGRTEERKNGRNRVNSKVPNPTKVGGPMNRAPNAPDGEFIVNQIYERSHAENCRLETVSIKDSVFATKHNCIF